MSTSVIAPIPPRPQSFSSEDGSIQGVMDGINTVFSTGVYLKQADIFLNGLVQTYGINVWLSGQFIIFLPGCVPQAGDRILASGYVGP